MLRLITAGESHGKSLTGILDGFPGGLEIDRAFVDLQLHRRQLGYGRGERMKIEQDRIEILSGIRHGRTLGSPISFLIENKDWFSWQNPMSVVPVPDETDKRPVHSPRPGHADLSGALKYQTHDIRDILERASARETASRVAAGAICCLLLSRFGIRIGSHVLAIGSDKVSGGTGMFSAGSILNIDAESEIRCLEDEAGKRMMKAIDDARASGDTLGGVLETVAAGVPPGLGSHIQWDRKMDGRIAQAMMSIPSAKAVEIGDAIDSVSNLGSKVHDEIFYSEEECLFFHKTNRAGGIEGGITNGEDIRVRIHVKPIPTLRKPLRSVAMGTKQPTEAAFERSDTCVVPAAGIVAESMLAFILADAFLEKFGGDSIVEIESNFNNYKDLLHSF
ncbi:MAG: chorismate synthase [Acidobacteriota bacterium]